MKNTRKPYDAILYHQCSSATTTKNWPWGRTVHELVWEYAKRKVVVTDDTKQIYLPYVPEKKKLSRDDLVVCGENVYQESEHVDRWLGPNNQRTVVEFRKWADKQLKISKVNLNFPSPNAAGKVSGLQYGRENKGLPCVGLST